MYANRGPGGRVCLWVMCCVCAMSIVHCGFSHYRNRTKSNWFRFNVPKTGMYLIMLIVDPPKYGSQTVEVRGNGALQGYGDGVVGGFDFAIPLTEGSTFSLDINPNDQGGLGDASALSAVYVSNCTVFNFVLAKRSRYKYTSTIGNYDLPFTALLSNDGTWLHQTHTHFTVSYTGIYWVTARPDPPFGRDTVVDICRNRQKLFSVFAAIGQAIVTSAAFRLVRNSHLSMNMRSRGVVLEISTAISYIYLVNNKQPITGRHDHIAYTSTVRPNQRLTYGFLQFRLWGIMTDHGSMYNAQTNIFTIITGGSYVVALRMDPTGHGSQITESLCGTLWVNGDSVWISYAEKGTPSGQSIALQLNPGQRMNVQKFGSESVDDGTMISIAFVYPID